MDWINKIKIKSNISMLRFFNLIDYINHIHRYVNLSD